MAFAGASLYVFPVYTGCEFGEGWLHALPLFFSWQSANETSYFLSGLYLHSSPTYSSQNFLYLLRHSHSRSLDQSDTRFRNTHSFGLGLDLLQLEPGDYGFFATAGYGYLAALQREGPGQLEARLI